MWLLPDRTRSPADRGYLAISLSRCLLASRTCNEGQEFQRWIPLFGIWKENRQSAMYQLLGVGAVQEFWYTDMPMVLIFLRLMKWAVIARCGYKAIRAQSGIPGLTHIRIEGSNVLWTSWQWLTNAKCLVYVQISRFCSKAIWKLRDAYGPEPYFHDVHHRLTPLKLRS